MKTKHLPQQQFLIYNIFVLSSDPSVQSALPSLTLFCGMHLDVCWHVNSVAGSHCFGPKQHTFQSSHSCTEFDYFSLSRAFFLKQPKLCGMNHRGRHAKIFGWANPFLYLLSSSFLFTVGGLRGHSPISPISGIGVASGGIATPSDCQVRGGASPAGNESGSMRGRLQRQQQ